MSEKKTLNDEQLKKVSGGSNNISWDGLKNMINQIVNVQSVSDGVDCMVRIIKVETKYGQYYSKCKVCVYAADELSYNMLNSKRFDSQVIHLWNCDGQIPQDTGLGYGKTGFRFVIEDGDPVYFSSI